MFDACALQGRKVEATTPLAMYNFFIERVKQNLHVVLAMSPIGDAFRSRLRMFPSLINCCTIDWFQVRGAGEQQDPLWVKTGPLSFGQLFKQIFQSLFKGNFQTNNTDKSNKFKPAIHSTFKRDYSFRRRW